MVLLKAIKYGVLALATTTAVGGLVFGREAASYFCTSWTQVRQSVKGSVPVEFQLQRARDLVGEIVPEMHANIRLIAGQEVEIGKLRDDIAAGERSTSDERVRLAKLRDSLTADTALVSAGGARYSHEEVKEDLSRRFESLKEADMILAGKKRLLENRQKSLEAATAALMKVRSQKAQLEAQVATLEGQHQLLKASATGTALEIDNGKLAQSQRLIGEIKGQLDVAERVLAHEAKFTQPIPVDAVDEKQLVSEIDGYLSKDKAVAAK